MKKSIFLLDLLFVYNYAFGNDIILRLESYINKPIPTGFIRSDVNQFSDIDSDTPVRDGIEMTMVQVEKGNVNMAMFSKIFSNHNEARQLLLDLYDSATDVGWEYIKSDLDKHSFFKNNLVLGMSLDSEFYPRLYTVLVVIGLY